MRGRMRFMTDPRQHGGHGPHGPHGAQASPPRAHPRRHPPPAGRAADARLRADHRARAAHRRPLEAEPRLGVPDAQRAGGRRADHGRRDRRQEALRADRGRSHVAAGAGRRSARVRRAPTGRRGPGAASAGSATSARWASCAVSAARCSASCARSGASAATDQQAQAKAILARTRDELYAVMAQPRGDERTTETPAHRAPEPDRIVLVRILVARATRIRTEARSGRLTPVEQLAGRVPAGCRSTARCAPRADRAACRAGAGRG